MSVVSTASQYLGTPYEWGGSTPNEGFDCSGLVQYSYAQNGISVPRTSQEQFRFTSGSRITNITDLQSGDLVFFKGSTGTATAPGHVGIYVGNGQFIEAPKTGDVVKVSNLATRPDFVGGGRVVGGASENLMMTTTQTAESESLNIVGKLVAAIVMILLGVLAVVFFARAFDQPVSIPDIKRKKKSQKEETESKTDVSDKKEPETKTDVDDSETESEEIRDLMQSIDDDIESIKNLLKE